MRVNQMAEIPKCNTTVNGKQFYSNIGSQISSFFNMTLDMYSAASGCCCFLLFLIIALTSRGPATTGTMIVYLCTLCCLLSTVVSTVSFFIEQKKLNDAVKNGRPCKDDKGNTIS